MVHTEETKTHPNIFVIIVTYNGRQWYDRCFESLRKSSIPIQTIVVDNASNDGSVDYIRSNYPEIIIIESKLNLGFGKGNNKAFQYALEHNCDYVFLLNQDTWLLESDAIERLVDISNKHPEFGIISPMHLRANLKEVGMLWENGNNRCSKQLVSDLYCGTMREVYETNYVNAAAWLLSLNTLKTVGGFDPIYQHYEEDDDYLNRTRFHGLKIGVCPSIRIVHDHQKHSVNPFEHHDRYHHEQELLVKLTDLNESRTIVRYIRYLIRKIIVSLVKFDFKTLSPYTRDFYYILKNRKRILFSRKKNSQIAPTWIQ